MVKLVFYGGVGEIGGNKVLLQDGDTRIFLDFGKSFSRRAYYFDDPFLVPREIEDFLELELIEPIQGVYKIPNASETQKLVDAIFISHVHADHVDHASLSHPMIPIYVGETGRLILNSLGVTRFRQIDNDLSELQFRTFRTGSTLKVGRMEIEPIHVDHSIPGSYGFIVHTSQGPMVYTGDFRLHGPNSHLSWDFLNRAKEVQPVALISEGTNAFATTFLKEKEIEEKMEVLIRSSKGLVAVSFLFKDVDRYRSIYRACKNAGRKLVLSLKHAHLLRSLRNDSKLTTSIPLPGEEEVYFLVRRRGCTYEWEMELSSQLEKMGRLVTSELIRENQKEFVVNLNLFDLPELVKIKPLPGSIFILSLTEPFNEEMELDYERLTHWLEHFGMPLYSLHSSGHVLPHDLKGAVEYLNPEKVFLIHSEEPLLLSKYLSDSASEVVIPEKGKEYLFG
ncbi:MAG: MBL fold metallo-hydrolase [Caldiserica bacterium]|jgi:ribonuclease J|nr:MBL fold metallo-hydrolase [Caldisericota bacterium]MDH7563172.1 MBL fold metallo-hydrolase [Caldisericota bacterium]